MHTPKLGILDLSQILGTIYDTLQPIYNVLLKVQEIELRIPSGTL
jgi:hypothetical protein